MRILGLIPARGGSKGVPGKNGRLLAGKPLIAYTIEAAKKAKLDHILVSTDSRDLYGIAREMGFEPPFLRPAALAQDDSTSLSVVEHALGFMENAGEHFDAVCLLQPTSPFRRDGFIDEAIARFESADADSLVSVLPVPHAYNPHWVFEPDNGFLKISTGEDAIISRRQELPPAYHRDGSVYLTRIETLKSGSFYGEKIAWIESDPDRHVNIDTMDDWEKAESIAGKLMR
jgi:N-acylneuraminate cytidylyltransferase